MTNRCSKRLSRRDGTLGAKRMRRQKPTTQAGLPERQALSARAWKSINSQKTVLPFRQPSKAPNTGKTKTSIRQANHDRGFDPLIYGFVDRGSTSEEPQGSKGRGRSPRSLRGPGGFQLVAGGDLNPRPPRYESDQGSRNSLKTKEISAGWPGR